MQKWSPPRSNFFSNISAIYWFCKCSIDAYILLIIKQLQSTTSNICWKDVFVFPSIRIKSTNRAQLRYINNKNIISISSGLKYIQYHPWYKSTSNCQYLDRKSLKGINSLIVGRHMKSHKWILTYSTSKIMSYLFTHRKNS